MNKKDNYIQTISIRITRPLYEQLQEAAETDDMTVSELIRQLLRMYVLFISLLSGFDLEHNCKRPVTKFIALQTVIFLVLSVINED